MQHANLTSLAILALKNFVQNNYGVTADVAARLLQDACDAQLDVWAKMAIDNTAVAPKAAKPATPAPAAATAAAPAPKAAEPAPTAATAAPTPAPAKSPRFKAGPYLRDEVIGGKEMTFAQLRNAVNAKKHEVLKNAVSEWAEKKGVSYDDALMGIVNSMKLTLKATKK